MTAPTPITRGTTRRTTLLVMLALALALLSSACRVGETIPPPSEVATVRRTEPFHLLAWNLNAGVTAQPEADIAEIARILAESTDIDLFGFSEVRADWLPSIEQALRARPDAEFEVRLSESGRLQRLALAWNTRRFELLEFNELHRVNADRSGRAPLAALLRDRRSGLTFLAVTVHLRSSNADAREEEAILLRDLLRQLDHPTLVFGDFNFRCPSAQSREDACHSAHDRFVDGGSLVWRRHDPLVSTHCHTHRYTSINDFLFTGFAANAWKVEATIAQDPGICSNRMGSTPHKAIRARVAP